MPPRHSQRPSVRTLQPVFSSHVRDVRRGEVHHFALALGAGHRQERMGHCTAAITTRGPFTRGGAVVPHRAGAGAQVSDMTTDWMLRYVGDATPAHLLHVTYLHSARPMSPIALALPCLLVVIPACASDDRDSGNDATPDTDTSADAAADADVDACGVLFGAPSENTGLTEAQCRPSCNCDGFVFTPPEYTAEQMDRVAAFELLDPPELLDTDPYDDAAAHAGAPDQFCAVLPDGANPEAYTLMTFSTASAAEDLGATVTHYGACGLCSSLQDLAVYMRHSDLSGPVRECGLMGRVDGAGPATECLLELGFTEPCAQIWYYNTQHTADTCSEPCLATLADAYQLPDGSLNACLQCDEDNSGPVFKAVAGRTRRNSGLPSALCRPCDSIAPIVHEYS